MDWSKVKLCKDCKYFEASPHSAEGSPGTDVTNKDLCLHPVNKTLPPDTRIDYVLGTPLPEFTPMFAREAREFREWLWREEISTGKPLQCGPVGRLYERL